MTDFAAFLTSFQSLVSQQGSWSIKEMALKVDCGGTEVVFVAPGEDIQLDPADTAQGCLEYLNGRLMETDAALKEQAGSVPL